MARRSPLGAVLGPDTHHQGDLTFEGRVRVDGRFTGRLYSEDCLEIGVSGVVDGECDVARAIVAGTLTGRVRVREHLLIESTGEVSGVLDAGVVELRAGGKLLGEVKIRGVSQGF